MCGHDGRIRVSVSLPIHQPTQFVAAAQITITRAARHHRADADSMFLRLHSSEPSQQLYTRAVGQQLILPSESALFCAIARMSLNAQTSWSSCGRRSLTSSAAVRLAPGLSGTACDGAGTCSPCPNDVLRHNGTGSHGPNAPAQQSKA
jgi:hypothetical protein